MTEEQEESESKEDRIKQHKRIQLTEVNVLRRLNLSHDECADEGTLRRFCASNGKTLPGMIDIEVDPCGEENGVYQWHITVWEQPNEKEETAA